MERQKVDDLVLRPLDFTWLTFIIVLIYLLRLLFQSEKPDRAPAFQGLYSGVRSHLW